MYLRPLAGWLCVCWLVALGQVSLAADESVTELLTRARRAYLDGEVDNAIRLASQAIERDSAFAPAWTMRGMLHAEAGKSALAVADFDRAIRLSPDQAELYQHRGSEQFKLGEIEKSIVDFDRYLQLEPQREARHWQRGISYYYAGEYAKGARQFEQYQSVDGNDVENAVWRYMCMARDVGVEKARAELLPIGHDRRVPMMEVYALFQGKATPEAVLQAAEADADSIAPGQRKLRLFYAHLYLGLYHEVHDQPELARQHITTAARDYPHPKHYMWNCADVHARRLAKAAGK